MLQKKRAVLTVAAIAWGTVAILLLLAFGEGLKNQFNKGRKGMGENIAVIWPGETSKPWKGLPAGRPIRPVADDISYIRARIQGDTEVIGEINQFGVTLSNGRRNISGNVTGTTYEYRDMRNNHAQSGGRFLDPMDEVKKRRVAFIGDKTAEDIFSPEPPTEKSFLSTGPVRNIVWGENSPVGKTLYINDTPYTIIGILQHKIQMGSYKSPDERGVTIPMNTFIAQFGDQQLSNFVLHVKQPDQMKDAVQRFREILGARYQFDPEDPKVVSIWDTVKSSKMMSNFTLGIQLFLGIIGSLTLFIGGIGVANIMYAVVKEKTREIGIQMALGARRSWITGPFILQGLVFTMLGGAWGMVISIILVILLGLLPLEKNQAMQFLGKPTLSWQIGFATAAILGLIGILAGYFPARRAASVDPAETLRYE